MKKDQIMNCFNTFFKKYPEKRFINNNCLEEIKFISKHYLYKEEIREWDELPNDISIQDLHKLDEKYKHTLKWKLIPSSLKEEDIVIFEKEMGLKLPIMF